MRFAHFLPLAALSVAFVVPDEQVLADLAVSEPQPLDDSTEPPKPDTDRFPFIQRLFEGPKPWSGVIQSGKNALDFALQHLDAAPHKCHEEVVEGFNTAAWLEDVDFGTLEEVDDDPGSPPHHGPPHHGPPDHEPPSHGPPHKKPHKKPHFKPHFPHHHKPNKTIYELITESKYTTVLAKLVANDTELVAVLNSTTANFTLFAPTDHAFAKIPKHAPKPSKEQIRELLLYHITPGFYPVGRLIFSHTVPTLYNETLLGDNPQRLVAKAGLKGISINFYSKVVAVNIPATNGIIHGVDSILILPPKAITVLELLPTEFSTLLLGLGKTGLIKEFATAPTVGGTFFAPPNSAFKKLGPRINAFLFSKFGEKYLKALLKYHIAANETLYSNAFYGPTQSELRIQSEKEVGADAVPFLHFDLPTLLDGKSLSVDEARFGPWITIKINGFTRVVVADGITKDGVIQVVNRVLIPPKRSHGAAAAAAAEYWQGDEMSVEEFKERLGPFIDSEESSFDL